MSVEDSGSCRGREGGRDSKREDDLGVDPCDSIELPLQCARGRGREGGAEEDEG